MEGKVPNQDLDNDTDICPLDHLNHNVQKIDTYLDGFLTRCLPYSFPFPSHKFHSSALSQNIDTRRDREVNV